MKTNAPIASWYPTTPIEGAHLKELASTMRMTWSDIEVRDLDMAMMLNVPPNRISHFKRAKSSIKGGADDGEKELEQGIDKNQIPMTHPHQAILIRLLMRHPEYATLVKRPTSQEVWDLISDFLPRPAEPVIRRGPAPKGDIEKKGFAPLFGRAAVSSYKMLPGDGSSSTGETSLAVTRLQMLILSRFADIFLDNYRRYASNHMFVVDRKNPLYEPQGRGWTVLRERDSLTGWMQDSVLTRFYSDVQREWREWFETKYLTVVHDEAVSRGKDPDEVMRKGNWTNNEPVTDQEFKQYKGHQKPITGEENYFSTFREMTQTTSAEMFWTLGMQVKAFYRFRERGDQRIDPPTAILVRYLMRNGGDLDYFVEQPPAGAWVFKKIQAIDPSFKRLHLAPLFGASKMASYKFAADEFECPYFARRLATIFARELKNGPEIYWQIRECVQDEVKARNLDEETFWKQGKWHG